MKKITLLKIKLFLLFGFVSQIFFAQCPTSDVTLFTQEDVNTYISNYGDCNIIEGNLFIGHTQYYGTSDITDISGLLNITEVHGSLIIRSNSGLESIEALQGITNITGDLSIYKNFNLDDCSIICTFDGADVIQGTKNIYSNSFNCKSQEIIEENCNPSECPPFSLYYETQEQVDSFLEKYPNCTELNKQVKLEGEEIQNLEAFSNIVKVNHYFYIENTSITNFNGLHNLKNATASFYVEKNDNISNFEGLNSLEEIGYTFYINDNNNLTSTDGLNSLKKVNTLTFSYNSNLTNLVLPSSLETITESFRVGYNDLLESIEINNNLQNKFNLFNLYDNPNLNSIINLQNDLTNRLSIYNCNFTSLDFLTNLEDLERLSLENNPNLINLNGLENLKEIAEVNILENENLSNIESISNLEKIYNNINISNNPSLEDCDAICSIIQNTEITISSIYLNNNGSECMDIDEILENCDYSDCPKEDMTFLTQEEIDNFAIQYPNCETLKVDIEIGSYDESSDITNLEAFSNIKKIIGDLEINNLESLINFNGFHNLEEVNGNFVIWKTSQVTNMEGFNSLTKVEYGEYFYISECENLINFQGLNSLETIKIDDDFNIEYNTSLINFQGLNNLETIKAGDDLEIYENESLINFEGLENLKYLESNYIEIYNNHSLQNFIGLDNIETFISNDYFEIYENENLINFEGFENLTTMIIDDFYIYNNPNLKSFKGFENITSFEENAAINIYENQNLESLYGFNNLIVIDELYISYNENLKTLKGLDNLQQANYLTVTSNNNLDCIKDLKNLISVTDLYIDSNNSLQSLEGLQNVTVENLYIYDNETLSECSAICHLLNLPNVYHYIQDNIEDCSSTSEIEENCSDNEVTYTETEINGFYDICPNTTFENLVILAENETISFYDSYDSSTPIALDSEITEGAYYVEIINTITGAISCRNYIEIEVEDIINPETIVLEDISSQCELLEADITVPTTTDNCSGEITATTESNLNFTEQGEFTIIWNFNDGNGNDINVSQTVIIEDTTDPETIVLEDISSQCELLEADITVPTTTDNCSGEITATTEADLNFTEQGEFEIIWNFVDAVGNDINVTQTVIIEDTTDPETIVLEDISSQCELLEADITIPTTTDNCAGEITATTESNLNFTEQGEFEIVWNFVDAVGNDINVTQTVIIEDTTGPETIVLENLTAQCELLETDITVPTTTDNCSGEITATTESDLNFTEQGTFEIVWIFNDGNDNEIEVIQVVTIEDTEAPTFETCHENVIIEMGSGCEYPILDYTEFDFGLTDNCSDEITITQSLEPGTIISESIEIVLTFTDINNNVSECSFMLEVIDTVAPSFECPETQTVLVDEDELYTLIDFTTDIPVSYACEEVTFTQTPESGTELEIGEHTITLEIEDVYGNTDSCEFLIKVTDDLNISEENLKSISIYPNPSTGKFFMETKTEISALYVTDATGKIVFKKRNKISKEFDLSSFDRGVYYITIQNENNSTTQKLILK
ncbi:T9SS type A sorting domain-containing protein [Aureivirga sp. CE67]|uniref:T9SS type A sorting domain-containing protein n=1 Tax=Aureivirga sp. CE67 TaxID=1788983 RepID=UPI0018CADF6C|nr:T9SS type A sorting domain-containing protein [Aureivirga sp. CE67]